MSTATLALPPYIQSVEDLRDHLQAAVELEHCTIPPYLTALYSIRPGHNLEAAEIIRSVVMQEMLHMVLAANVLNAIGGAPDIDNPAFVPSYPVHLPVGGDGPTLVGIAKFSPQTIQAFLAIEKPARPHGRTNRVDRDPPELTPAGALLDMLRRGEIYDFIGDFYEAIEQGLNALEARARQTGGTIFTGQASRQVTPAVYYNGGGEVVTVTNLADALEALKVIIDQGEGYGDTVDDGDDQMFRQPSELAHFYRFNQIAKGRFYLPSNTRRSGPTGPTFEVRYDDEAVYPMADNPDPTQYADPVLAARSHAFSLAYTRLLGQLHAGCNGQPEAVLAAIPNMIGLKALAIDLLRNPVPGR